MQCICSSETSPGASHLCYLSFRGIELHVPSVFPSLKFVQVILEGGAVELSLESGAVVHSLKKTDTNLYTWTEPMF